MPTPEINLSPSERKLLQATVQGRQNELQIDWLALRRLVRVGFLEETETSIRITAEGKRALSAKE